jgi:hypothetical protein
MYTTGIHQSKKEKHGYKYVISNLTSTVNTRTNLMIHILLTTK